MDDHEAGATRRWMPFLLPVVVFGAAIAFIVPLGYAFLQIAIATGESFHEPWPHSTGVIIVALIISLLIAGIAAIVASRPETPVPPRDSVHH